MHAAGDVTLPFSYSATHLPAPKPDNLDFSHQVSPDNCEVFIRIDGELWEFRSQWVVNLGTTARYKGPDIDHMTRVEDGAYPDGMTSCWFLGGMWYDDSEQKLYAPMHIEHDGIRRSYPFSRKIALATSRDKGRTWRYEGDIITSETYYYTHDFFKFSGSGYGNGVGRFWILCSHPADISTSSQIKAGNGDQAAAFAGTRVPPAARSETKWRPANGNTSTTENGMSPP